MGLAYKVPFGTPQLVGRIDMPSSPQFSYTLLRLSSIQGVDLTGVRNSWRSQGPVGGLRR